MNHVLQLDVTVLAFISGTLIPLLVGVVAKAHASPRLKALLNLILSVIAGVVSAWTLGKGVITPAQVFTAAMTTYLASGVSYQNLWKPAGVAAAVQSATSSVGIGQAQPITPEPAPVPVVEESLADKLALSTTDPRPAPPVPEPEPEPEPEEFELGPENQVTTLKGKPVYHDPTGYLLIELDA